jgi:hypothetical protein
MIKGNSNPTILIFNYIYHITFLRTNIFLESLQRLITKLRKKKKNVVFMTNIKIIMRKPESFQPCLFNFSGKNRKQNFI